MIEEVLDHIAKRELELKQIRPEGTKNIRIPGIKHTLTGNARNIESSFVEFAKEKGAEVARRFSESLELELKTKLDSALRASWGWTSGSRDIIDTGELAGSLSISNGPDGVSFSYDSEYAGLVHYGGYIRPYGNPNAELVYLPARPWIDAVLGNAPGPIAPIDFDSILSKAAR